MNAPASARPNAIAAALDTLKASADREAELERENTALRAQLAAIRQAAADGNAIVIEAPPTAQATVETSTVPMRTARHLAIREALIEGIHQHKSSAQIARKFGVKEPTIRRTIWEMVTAGEIKPRAKQIRRKRKTAAVVATAPTTAPRTAPPAATPKPAPARKTIKRAARA